MVIDQRIVVGTVDETKEVTIKVAGVTPPPIPLWKVVFISLGIVGSGAAYYAVTKKKGKK